MITPSLKAGLAQLQALVSYIDAGEASASIIYYETSKPNSLSIVPAESAKLATLTFPKPCFKRLNFDSVELHPTNDTLATKTGTAVWARLFNGLGEAVADFEMGTDIILNNYDLVLGATQRLESILLKPSF